MIDVTEHEKALLLQISLLFVAVVFFMSVIFGDNNQTTFLPADVQLERVSPMLTIPDFVSN